MHVTASDVAIAFERGLPQLANRIRPDFARALDAALASESSERGASVLRMLKDNHTIAASEERPLCQDTGTVRVRLTIGPGDSMDGDVFSLITPVMTDVYRRMGWRMSTVDDAFTDRSNPDTNAPVFTSVELGEKEGPVLDIMLKGGGSDNASSVLMLPPSAGEEGIAEALLDLVRRKASSACPPLVIGVGIGGTFDSVADLAFTQLYREVGEPAAEPEVAALEERLLSAVNATGIGPAGLGGDTTALAVHVGTEPCHIAALPVAFDLGCSALRSISLPLGVETDV